jgi:hypothetical protein
MLDKMISEGLFCSGGLGGQTDVKKIELKILISFRINK